MIAKSDMNIDIINKISELPIDLNILDQGLILHINTMNKDTKKFNAIGFNCLLDKDDLIKDKKGILSRYLYD